MVRVVSVCVCAEDYGDDRIAAIGKPAEQPVHRGLLHIDAAKSQGLQQPRHRHSCILPRLIQDSISQSRLGYFLLSGLSRLDSRLGSAGTSSPVVRE